MPTDNRDLTVTITSNADQAVEAFDEGSTYAETLTRLARAYHRAKAIGPVPEAAFTRLTARLHGAADRAGIGRSVADEDFAEELQETFVDLTAD